MSRSEPALKPRDVESVLGTALAAYYGARQLVRDLDRFPHSIEPEERTRIEEGTKRLELTLRPLLQQIGATALSPDRTQALAESVRAGSPEEIAWRRFHAQVDQLRETTGRASRILRLRKGTAEFLVGSASPDEGDRAPALDAEALRVLKRLNRQLLALEVLAGTEKPESSPPRILVDVTNKCNFRCRTCYQSHNQDFVYFDIARAPFEKLRPFLDAAEVVNFAGTGEPLLSPDTPEMIRMAAASGVETELVTNGSLFHRLKGLEQHLSRVFLSFDGGSAETVDTIRKGAKFENIVADLRAMPELLRRKLGFNMVVCRPNVHEISRLARLARELRVGALHLQAFYPYLPWHDAMALREEDLALLATEVDAARRELEGTGVTFNVTFPVDSVPERAAGPSKPVPEQPQILAQLNRLKPPGPPDPESWDTLTRRFTELSSLELPAELRAALADSPTSSRALAIEQTRERLQARIDALLADLHARPALQVPTCLAPHTLLYLVGDGTTRPCCILETRIGDLHADAARDVWHSSGSVELRRSAARGSGLPPSCDGCTDGGRFGFLHALLLEAQGLGVDMRKVALPADAPVPPAVVAWLKEAQTCAALDFSRALGHLDIVEGSWIAGWALNPDLGHQLLVEIFVDGNLIQSAAADILREDLRAAGVGTGWHGFSTNIPEYYVDGRTHEIQVRFARTGKQLTGSPRVVRLARDP
ncbi:MAG TPA: radical SAM protein [Polyangiaceae bacterium]|nr:radical SAM protein [Polyangiaceae bacterium]